MSGVIQRGRVCPTCGRRRALRREGRPRKNVADKSVFDTLDSGFTVSETAQRYDVSRAYIYQRMKTCQYIPKHWERAAHMAINQGLGKVPTTPAAVAEVFKVLGVTYYPRGEDR